MYTIKYIVEKYIIYLHELFWPVSQRVQINLYLPTVYVHCVSSAMSKSQEQVSNCLNIAETSVVIIVFNGVLF